MSRGRAPAFYAITSTHPSQPYSLEPAQGFTNENPPPATRPCPGTFRAVTARAMAWNRNTTAIRNKVGQGPRWPGRCQRQLTSCVQLAQVGPDRNQLRPWSSMTEGGVVDCVPVFPETEMSAIGPGRGRWVGRLDTRWALPNFDENFASGPSSLRCKACRLSILAFEHPSLGANDAGWLRREDPEDTCATTKNIQPSTPRSIFVAEVRCQTPFFPSTQLCVGLVGVGVETAAKV